VVREAFPQGQGQSQLLEHPPKALRVSDARNGGKRLAGRQLERLLSGRTLQKKSYRTEKEAHPRQPTGSCRELLGLNTVEQQNVGTAHRTEGLPKAPKREDMGTVQRRAVEEEKLNLLPKPSVLETVVSQGDVCPQPMGSFYCPFPATVHDHNCLRQLPSVEPGFIPTLCPWDAGTMPVADHEDTARATPIAPQHNSRCSPFGVAVLCQCLNNRGLPTTAEAQISYPNHWERSADGGQYAMPVCNVP
jgi:hypothetical protein